MAEINYFVGERGATMPALICQLASLSKKTINSILANISKMVTRGDSSDEIQKEVGNINLWQ